MQAADLSVAAHELAEAEHVVTKLHEGVRYVDTPKLLTTPTFRTALFTVEGKKEERTAAATHAETMAAAVAAAKAARLRYNACLRAVGSAESRLAATSAEIVRLEECVVSLAKMQVATVDTQLAAESSAEAILRLTQQDTAHDRPRLASAEVLGTNLRARATIAERANAAPVALRVIAGTERHAALAGTWLMCAAHSGWPVYRRCTGGGAVRGGGAFGAAQFIYRTGEWEACWVVGEVVGSRDGWLRSDEGGALHECTWFAARTDGTAWERCDWLHVETASIEATQRALLMSVALES